MPGNLRVTVVFTFGTELPVFQNVNVTLTSNGTVQPTGTDGKTTFTGLNPGDYTVEVNDPRCQNRTAKGTVTSVKTADITVTVTPLGNFQIHVHDDSETDAATNGISAAAVSTGSATATTDALGNALIQSQISGHFRFEAKRAGFTTNAVELDARFKPGDTVNVDIPMKRVTVEIQINKTADAKDDVVQVKCSFPSHSHNLDCQARIVGATAADVTVVLTNPDGRMRFPNVADTTLTMTLPANGNFGAFTISGDSASGAIGDAKIEAHLDAAGGRLLGTKPGTVFSFDQAEIKLTQGGTYRITGGMYDVTGGVACNFAAKARIRPAGVDCTAPQISTLKIGIAQESSNFRSSTRWASPTIAWDPSAASGASVTVPAIMETASTYAATVTQPVNDQAITNPTVLYENRAASMVNPIGCTGGTSAVSSDGPNQPTPPNFTQPVSVGGVVVGTVTWSNPAAARKEHFRTFCMVLNTGTNVFCALRQATWDLDADSSRATPQHATVNADAAATVSPATGVNANSAPSTTTTAAFDGTTKVFTKP